MKDKIHNYDRAEREKNIIHAGLGTLAVAGVLVFATIGQYAFADVLNADQVDTNLKSVSIVKGETADIEYWIVANGGDGCNVDSTHLATVSLNIPSGVTASTITLTFDKCAETSTKNSQIVTFTGDTVGGPYSVNASVSGGKPGNNGWNANPATISITVTAPPTPADTTAPTTTATLSPSDPNGNNGWYTSPVEVTLSATDPDDSVASTTYEVDGGSTQTYTNPFTVSEDGQHTVTFRSTDSHTNTETPDKTVSFKIDQTPPTNVQFVGGSITDGGSYYFGFIPDGPTSCTAEDATSGFDHCDISGGGSTVGSHSYTATAYDKAGNQATKELHYIVLAWTLSGFYQPVDMGSIVNTVKAGSTVPFKFEIFAGNTELTSTTFDSKPIGTFSATKVDCTSGTSADAIEVTSTGGTSFRYDTTAGQFLYNWQTPKAGAGSCYDVTFTTLDGSSLTAHFKLK